MTTATVTAPTRADAFATRINGGAAIWGITNTFVMAALVPWYLVRQAQDNQRSIPWVVVILMVIAGLRLGSLAGGKIIRPMTLTFWIFVYVWFGLSVMAQVVTNIAPLTYAGDLTAANNQMAGLVLLGILARFVAELVARRRDDGQVREIARPINLGRLRLMSFAAFATVPLYLHYAGGLRAQFTSREAANIAIGSGQSNVAIVTAFGQVLPFLSLLAWTVVLARQRNRDQRVGFGRLTWVLLLGCNLIVNNPISNSRQWFGTVAVAFLLTWRRMTINVFRLMVPLLTLVLSVLFPYLDYFRYTGGATGGRTGVLTKMAEKDYDANAQISNIFQFVHYTGFDFGHQMLGCVGFAIPRKFWPGKPVDTGVLIARFIQSPNENLSAPMWGELFLAFGIPAVVLGFALLGWVSYRSDLRYGLLRASRDFGSLVGLAAPIFAGYQIILLRGSLLQATGRLVALGLALWFLAPKVHPPKASPDRPGWTRSPSGRLVPAKA